VTGHGPGPRADVSYGKERRRVVVSALRAGAVAKSMAQRLRWTVARGASRNMYMCMCYIYFTVYIVKYIDLYIYASSHGMGQQIWPALARFWDPYFRFFGTHHAP